MLKRFVIATPEVVVRGLDPARDRFLVLGTDGLWDFLSVGDAAAIVLHTGSPQLARLAARNIHPFSK